MRIYVASSWRNGAGALGMASILRSVGHEVDCFCDDSGGRYVFHWREITDKIRELNARTFLLHPQTQLAFAEDRKWLDWAEGVVMVLPCGNSAHLEAGYAVGRGKPLWIFGDLPAGEFDVMYGFANLVTEDIRELLQRIAEESPG